MRQIPSFQRVVTALAAISVLTATVASGQTVATNFEELRLKVKPGDTVLLTVDGAEQKVRILDLTSSSLAISLDGGRRELRERDVIRIRQRRPDALKNGALIGFLVGAAGSTAGAVTMASPTGSCKGRCVTANVLFGGGLGVVAGLGIDAVIQGWKVIYAADGGRQSGIVERPSRVLRQVRATPSLRRPSTRLMEADDTHPLPWVASLSRSARVPQATEPRNWIQKHPVLFGTMAGFGAGFLIGYLPGDDAVFDDFTDEFNGLVLGGAGAGAGALVGWAVSR